MKNILFAFLLISTTFYAQNYDKNWNKVIENENNGKIKSANAIVSNIHKKAIADKNEVQIIKCFFYESKYMQVLDENAQTKIINNLKAEIEKASIPSKAILNLVLAKCLEDYYNSYFDYTAVAVDTVAVSDKPSTKPQEIFHFNNEEKPSEIFKKTLENEDVLKVTPLTNYEAIFDFFKLEKFKKESLYHYLLKENITFYERIIHEWEIESKEYEVHKNILLGDTNLFTKLNLDFIKNENLKKTISFYQKLEIDSPTIDNQLDRLLFCNYYIIKSEEDLLQRLITLEKEIKEASQLQKIQLQKAIIYSNLASKETHPDYNSKAISELDSILAIQNNSITYKQAIRNKEELLTKKIEVHLEKYIYDKEISRAFIRYKNSNNLTISFYKINYSKIAEFYNVPDKKDSLVSQIISNKKPLITKKYELIDKKDFF